MKFELTATINYTLVVDTETGGLTYEADKPVDQIEELTFDTIHLLNSMAVAEKGIKAIEDKRIKEIRDAENLKAMQITFGIIGQLASSVGKGLIIELVKKEYNNEALNISDNSPSDS